MKSTHSDIILAGADDQSVTRVRRAWDSGRPFLLATAGRGFVDADLDRAAAALRSLPATSFGLLTSGSTGRPKVIVGRRERAIALAGAIAAAQDLGAVSTTVSVLPLGYSYAFVNQWVWSTSAHRSFVSVAGGVTCLRDALGSLDDVHLCLVGAQVPALLRGAWSSDAVTHVCFAGGPFPSEYLPSLRSMFPRARFFNNYGCTEAMPRISIRNVAPDETPPANAVGLPLAGIELRASEGSLEFRSPYRAVGAIVDDRYVEWSTDKWIATGDKAEFVDSEWHLLGREDDVFKRYGERIALGELRAQLASEGIAVDLVPERDRRDEPGYRMILHREDDVPLAKRVVRAWRRSRWPNAIELIEGHAFNAHGKLDRETLTQGRTIWTNE